MKGLGRGFLVLAAIASLAPPPSSAQLAAYDVPGDDFDRNARAWYPLRALLAKAVKIDDDDAVPDSEKIAAWQALADAGLKARLPRGRIHPLGGYALVQLAAYHHEAGDDTLALSEAQRGLDILRSFREAEPADYIHAVSTVGFLLSYIGRPTEALPALAEAAEWYEPYFAKLPKEKLSGDEYMAKSNIDYAYSQALTQSGRFEEAVKWQKLSFEARTAGQGPDAPTTITAMWAYGFSLFKAGQEQEGEDIVRKAVEAAVAHVDPKNPVFARTFDAMGLILSRRGKRAEAVEYLRRSIEIRRVAVGTQNANFFSTMLNLGDTLIDLERYDEARTMLLEASRGAKAAQGDDSLDGARALAFAGLADLGEGDAKSARERLAAGLAIARGKDANEKLVGPKVIPPLIVAEIESGDASAARMQADAYFAEVTGAKTSTSANRALAALLRAYAANDPGAGDAARAMVAEIRRNTLLASSGELPQTERSALDIVLQIAARGNDGQLALDAMVILAGSKIAQANRLVAARIAAVDPKLAARVREQQDAAKAYQAADAALLKAYAAGSGIEPARAARDAASVRLDAVQTALTRDYPTWSAATGVTAPDLAALQRGLDRDQAILAAIPAFDGAYTLTITHKEAKVRRTALNRAALVGQVAKLRASLPTGSFDRDAAATLYEQLFPKADAAMLRGIKAIRYVPAGPLAALPIDVLLTRRDARAGQGAPWLIRKYAVSVSPAFAEPSLAPVARAQRVAMLLGIGDPAPFPAPEGVKPAGSPRYFRGASVDVNALGALPRLPGTRLELDAVARDFGSGNSRLLLGGDASEARLRSMDLAPFGTILFATHALVAGEMEGIAEPSLVLSPPAPGEAGDGVLTASEIATLKLDADWVILSGCNTAAGEDLNAAAYSGLAQAFRYAGARTLLLSHWPIRDDAARFVTVETIANARKGMRRDIALQQAMLKLLKSRTIPGAGDPYIWAPYILLGDATGE